MFLVSQVSGLVKKLDIGIFSDTKSVTSFELCMIITLLRVYIFNVDLITLTFPQGHRFVRNINCKLCFLDSCLVSFVLSLNVVWELHTFRRSGTIWIV